MGPLVDKKLTINVGSDLHRTQVPGVTETSAASKFKASTDQEKAIKLPLLERKGIRQFVKFCIVGCSSFGINFIVFNLLYHHTQVFTLVAALTVAFLLSVFNGFIWNRKWTFKEARASSVADQSIKFMLVNIVGWMLNTGITVGLIAAWQILHVHSQVQFGQIFWDILSGKKEHYSKLITNCALLGATGVVVFWNFFANRKWTFKH